VDVAYVQAKNLHEALRLLAAERWTILSGGTDVYPGSLERPMASRVMDIHALDELKTITHDASHVRIGAGVTWSDVIAAELPAAFDALKLAAHEIGSVQIQNRATIVGNLCNASPAADGVPPLLVLDAQIELSSLGGIRQIPLQEFILGNRLVALQPDEMVTAIVIPVASCKGHSTFMKLGARKYLIISISMVAAKLRVDENGLIAEAAVSVGSCSLVAQRLTSLEAALYKQSIADDLAKIVSVDHLLALSPIDDVRSSAEYRMQASLELVKRSLSAIGNTFA